MEVFIGLLNCKHSKSQSPLVIRPCNLEITRAFCIASFGVACAEISAWTVADVQAFIGNLEGGKFRKYLENFATLNVDGERLLGLSSQSLSLLVDHDEEAVTAIMEAIKNHQSTTG